MEILAAIAGKLAEFTVAPIGRQVGYLAHHKSNHQKLQTKLEDVSAARDEVRHQVDQFTREGKRIETTVLNWKTRVDAIITEAEEFLKDGRHAQTECLPGFCPHLVLRYQLSKKSAKLLKEIDEHYGKKKFSNFAYDVPLQEVCLSSTGHYSAFDSRNSIVMRVMNELRNPNTEMILVYGIGGVGKTTLVEEVLRKAKDDNLFDDVVMVRDVKENLDLEKIQKEITTKLGLSIDENRTLAERAPSLCERIKQKRTLVVLDDVWEEIDLLAVGVPRLVTCKVVLTCRSRKDLSLDRRTQTDISLDVLNEEEAWSLFEKMAGDVIVKDSCIRSVATEVAKKCGGLPVLIVTVARALKDRNMLHHWKDTLRRLRGFDNKELKEKTDLALEWSYHQLEDTVLKPLFLLCGIIVGKNHISLVDLLRYGFGLGMIKNVDTIEDAREALYTLVDKLKDSCLLLDSDINTHVRMHDLVCEVATRIASSKHHVLSVGYGGELKEWPDKDFFKRCSKISLKSSNIPMHFELPWECPKLEMFHLNGEDLGVALPVEFPSNFFSEMEKLKVMGLTGVDMVSLPSSLQFLKNVQTLCLEECKLEDVALVGYLSNLEILSFARSNIKQLPEEIGQLIRLRWLDLTKCEELEVISPNVISRLERLEELSMRNVFLEWEAEKGGSNASLLELKDLSQLTALEIYIADANILPSNLFSSKLVRYQICIGDAWECIEFGEEIMAETTLNTLNLKHALSNELDHGIEVLLKRCEDLSLDGIENFSTIARQLHVEDFQQLIHLRLQNNVDFTYIINRKVVFPNLTTLNIWNCDHLSFLFSFSMAKSLVELKHLEVSTCAIMEEIVSTRDQSNGENIDIMFCKLESITLHELLNLARFFTDSCIELPPVKNFDTKQGASIFDPMSSEKFDVESGTVVRTCLFDPQVRFPSLEKLKIERLMKLQRIWNNQLVDQDSFPRLREVNVSKCNSLLNVFVPRMMGILNALETLAISDCDSLEVVFEVGGIDVEETPADRSSSPSQLRPFYCQSLGSVSISSCTRLKKIFPASVARGLQKLHSLDVRHCDEVEEIIVGEQGLETEPPQFVFPKVTCVKFSDLPKLSRFYPGIHASKWPLLKKLFICSCGKVMFNAERPIFSETHVLNPLIKQSLFLIDKDSFPNLEELTLQFAGEIWYGPSSLARFFPKLKSIHFYKWALLSKQAAIHFLEKLPNLEEILVGFDHVSTEIFVNEEINGGEEIHALGTTLSGVKTLTVAEMHKLLQLGNGNSQTAGPLFPNLDTLLVSYCYMLKSVESSAISFRNLTTLKVDHCDGLVYLTSYSVAKSLMQLTTLHVRWCRDLRAIIGASNEDDHDTGATCEIAFSRLQHLTLLGLSRLQGFCSGNCIVKLPSSTVLDVRFCGIELKISSEGVLHAQFVFKTTRQDDDEAYRGKRTRRHVAKRLKKKNKQGA